MLDVPGALAGLAFVSGMRLYSTVLAVGLGLRFGALALPPPLSHLEVLSSTPVLVVAGILYLVEFVADKVPWVDSLWDTIHTFIRPLGAAVLGLAAVGDVDPALKAGAFLLSGSIALSSHSAKAGTRLLVNHSPEPFSNIGLSLVEDGLVVAGVWLAIAHPVIALGLVIVLVAIIVWTLPKLVRLFRRSARTLANFVGMRRPGAANVAPTGPRSNSFD